MNDSEGNDPAQLRAARLEELLDTAWEMDERKRVHWLQTVEPELRIELVELLAADGKRGLLDATPIALVKAAEAASAASGFHSVAAGQLVDRYRLLRLIGEGGMASVWLAARADGKFHYQVAIKCLKTGLATAESRERFLREQKILASLQHPNIARLYDADVSEDGVPYIVMEWIDGDSLTVHCDRRRLPLEQRLRLFQKVGAAAAYAHQNLVVHRDIKPGNILVGADGEPKLLDFGIAKPLDDSEPMTRSGLHLLTPEYAAPEQFNGAPITTATDVYGLGGVLYELLCGVKPRHFIKNPQDYGIAITAPSESLRRITPITDTEHLSQVRATASNRLRKTLQGDLDTIVLKALQTEPQRRYATAQALNDDIDRYLRQQPIEARKDTVHYRLRMFLQRHVLSVALGALVAATLLAATGISLYQAQRAREESQRALAIKQFLLNLFETSDSGMPRDQVPTTQTLLEDGAKRIRTEFGKNPELKLDLLLMIGKVQTSLGLYDSAQEVLKEAKDIADTQIASNSDFWLRAHTEWAILMGERSQFESAAQELENSITRQRISGHQESAAVVDALLALSQLYGRMDRFDERIAKSEQALKFAKRLYGERHPIVQRALQKVGEALADAGQWGRAEEIQRSALALSRELYGTRHAIVADNMAALAGTLSKGKQQYVEAESLARAALAIDESVYDHPNSTYIRTLGSLGLSLLRQRKFPEAEAVYQRELAMQTQLLGPEDSRIADTLYNLGVIACRSHRYEDAQRLLLQSADMTRKFEGESSRFAETLEELAMSYRLQGRKRDALEAYWRAFVIEGTIYGEKGAVIALNLGNIALTEYEMNSYLPALGHIDQALAVADESSEKIPPLDLLQLKKLKSDILAKMGKYGPAADLLHSIVTQLQGLKDNSLGDITLVEALMSLGEANAATGDPAGAREDWQEALKLARGLLPLGAEIDQSYIKKLEQSIADSYKPAQPPKPGSKKP